jgi:5'-3' exonuclease
MTWLLIDANNVARRAYYAMRNLAYDDVSTGMYYGFLRDLYGLCQRFETENFAFCFDHPERLRSLVYPEYKKREENQPELKSEIRSCLEKLPQILWDVGFRNIFQCKGYEADDLIAGLVAKLGGDDLVIVSTDKDFYQLLSGSVSMWKPGTKGGQYTIQSLWREFKVHPKEWAEVKAIAGCETDNVLGVYGVAELTAARFIRGTLPVHTIVYNRIIDSQEIIARNRILVTLPYPGLTDQYKLTILPSQLTHILWNGVVEGMNMKSLKNMAPFYKSARTLFKG